MSRDSRLIRTHLLHLREHLEEHNADVEQQAAAAHRDLEAKRSAPARDTHQPIAHELPERAKNSAEISEPKNAGA